MNLINAYRVARFRLRRATCWLRGSHRLPSNGIQIKQDMEVDGRVIERVVWTQCTRCLSLIRL